ncbi:MAG: NUDIX domain-containing protein [Anaerolineales bacterium]|nr:MAG: NUDIX domain-containing protein [Anaerolineales bacterium]
MIEELLDIVDDNDHVIGQESRTIVHQRGLQHRGVHVFLFTDDGKMLIQKRSADRAASPSLLDCSISEHVKAGEDYHDAAVRGMKEELGVEGIEIERLTKFRMNYGVNDNEISELYQGVVHPELVQFDPVEIESVMYLSMDELRRMLQEQRPLLCGWFVEMLDLYFNGRGKMQVMG